MGSRSWSVEVGTYVPSLYIPSRARVGRLPLDSLIHTFPKCHFGHMSKSTLFMDLRKMCVSETPKMGHRGGQIGSQMGSPNGPHSGLVPGPRIWLPAPVWGPPAGSKIGSKWDPILARFRHPSWRAELDRFWIGFWTGPGQILNPRCPDCGI